MVCAVTLMFTVSVNSGLRGAFSPSCNTSIQLLHGHLRFQNMAIRVSWVQHQSVLRSGPGGAASAVLTSRVRMQNLKNVRMPQGNAAGRLGGLIVAGGALLYGVSNSLFNVEGGHRAIVFNRVVGIKETVYEEGTHLMLPWFDRPIIYDVRTRPNVIQSTSGSKDLQMVNIGLRVLTRPLPAKLPEIYRTLGTDYAERVLPSIIQETLKSVIAQYNASQLLTMREVVSRDIRRILTQRAQYFNIYLDDVSITNLTFSREYTGAVEAKQVAQQEAERARFIVDKAEQDKQSAIIKAQGEATSARLIGEAIQQNPAFITLRKIEAARDIAGTISSAANKVFLSSDSLLLNLGDMDVLNQARIKPAR